MVAGGDVEEVMSLDADEHRFGVEAWESYERSARPATRLCRALSYPRPTSYLKVSVRKHPCK